MSGSKKQENQAMKSVALNEVKDDLSRYLRLAEKEDILITRHGKPAGVLIGFASEDECFDYRLEHDPRFLQRIERARQSLRAGRGVKLEEVPKGGLIPAKATMHCRKPTPQTNARHV
jgi:prevent-host-death family protein